MPFCHILLFHAVSTPDKQLLSHPLDIASPASDDAQSAAYLTSSEPSRASSFTAQPAAHGPSPASQLLCKAAEQPSDSDARDTAAQQDGSMLQQRQQSQGAASPLAKLGSPLGSPLGEGNAQLYHDSEHSPVEPAAALTAPIEGVSPARGEYDPELYKQRPLPASTVGSSSSQSQHRSDAQAQPLDTQLRPVGMQDKSFSCEHDSWSTQGFETSTQPPSAQTQAQPLSAVSWTQPLGHSPKQAALLKLRSLSIKQSQTIKAPATLQPPLLPADNSPDALSQPLTNPQDTQQASLCIPAAEPHMPAHAHRLGPNHKDQPAAEVQSPAMPEQQSSNRELAMTEGTKAPAVPLSPRRSSTVAKLRTQSLTKQLQDPRYASVRRFPLMPISGAGRDALQHFGALASCSIAASSNIGQVPTTCEQQALLAWDGDSQQLSNPDQLQLAKAGSDRCQVISPEPEGGAAFRLQDQHQQLMAESEGTSDRAKVKQPCPEHESAGLDLAHIDLMEDSIAPSASASIMTRSAESALLVSTTSATGAASAMSHQMHGSGSRSEGASPVKLSINSETSHHYSDLAHSGSVGPSLRHHADASGVQEKAARRSGSDCAVAVCIRSSGTGATVSMEVQSDSAHDSSHAAQAAAVTQAVASAAELPDESATVESADTAPCAVQDLDLVPVSPSHSVEAAQAAATNVNLSLIGETSQEPDACNQHQLPPDEPPAVDPGSKQGPVVAASSPVESAGKAVSSSPKKVHAQGQGLLGRLEGGLRSLLGRASKQQVRLRPAFAKCRCMRPCDIACCICAR